jgi:fructosamine-3-kinase
VNTLQLAPLAIPDSLRRNIRYIKGDRADAWLDRASSLALRLAGEWDVVPESVLEGGAMSLCVLCREADRTPVVLKVPANRVSGIAESSALAAWDNGAVPKVLTTDEATGAFLMEFITSGGPEPATGDIAALLARLHTPATREMYDLDAVLQARIRGAATRFAGLPEETADLEAARGLIAALQRTAEPVMVHGDFQAKNVLHGDAGPVAIDPLPAVGDPYSDLGLWIGGGSAGPRSAALWRYTAASPDPLRLLAWAWALTVVELRQGDGNEDAREFIAGNRTTAVESMAVPA